MCKIKQTSTFILEHCGIGFKSLFKLLFARNIRRCTFQKGHITGNVNDIKLDRQLILIIY